MLMRWSRNMPKPADTWPAIGELAGRMKALPSFKELYKLEALTEWAQRTNPGSIESQVSCELQLLFQF